MGKKIRWHVRKRVCDVIGEEGRGKKKKKNPILYLFPCNGVKSLIINFSPLHGKRYKTILFFFPKSRVILYAHKIS